MFKTYFKKIAPLSLFSLLLFPQIADAHIVGGNGFTSGLTHPLFGLDHLLAMVAVGIMSTQINKEAVWKVPLAFVTFMVVGGTLAILGMPMPMTEMGIALSVLILGVILAFNKNLSLPLSILCVSLFAVFHGHAHGAEMPLVANPTLYASGFVFGTTILHITGVSVGLLSKKISWGFHVLRFSGASIAILGVLFLLGY
jgi:urease accessory protein